MQTRLYNKFVRFVTCKMPNITSLHCLIIDDNPTGSYIGNQLTDFYAYRLKHLKSLIPLTLTAPQLSNELTFLQMSISSKAGHQIPLVYRDSLKHLSLCNVPRNYQWKSFVSDSVQENIEFANLKHLEIYYKLDSQRYGSGEQSSGPSTLSFPKLKRLYLFRCYEHCQLLESAMLPEKLENVYLHCAPFLLVHLLSHRWKFIDNLEVNIEAGAIDNPRYFFRHTNMLFGNKYLAQNSSLTLGELPNIPHMNALNWSRMTSLTIIYQLEVRQLLVLLEKMPSLTKLSVLSLDVGSLPASIANEKHVKKYKCAENNTLTFAKLNAVNVKPCGPNYLAFIRYFVLKYASLEHLCVSPSALFYTRALVEAYSQVCPHLATTGVFASSELY
ncbi:hypothetical protein LPJ79_002018 [Coemansia sp. RSA 1821]|nr:hypothetical protein LPJ68_004687 [Coemansia sp. RSA 1086]KAJ1751539.1 hypothetical protein LPJ79_002018 [Coemansia sp. RSA 1821]